MAYFADGSRVPDGMTLQYHREDEPLVRLFLDDDRTRRLDRLWDEHRFISQQPVAENDGATRLSILRRCSNNERA
jgi:hypothetical protein